MLNRRVGRRSHAGSESSNRGRFRLPYGERRCKGPDLARRRLIPGRASGRLDDGMGGL